MSSMTTARFLRIKLDIQQNNMMAMMVSLQRRLDQMAGGDRERQFYVRTMRYLASASGRAIDMKDWMITTYDVEFEHEIGSGG